MRKIRRLFRKLSDPRASNARYPLMEVIIVALAATLCGARTCTEMAQFGHSRSDVLRKLLKLEHGTPSHDTFSAVFRALDPQAFQAALGKFADAFNRQLGRYKTIAIDGKALRGAYRRGERSTPMQLVNVWANAAGMALAQTKAPNRNEFAGALEALALLRLDGAIVTSDALHCSAITAQLIRDRGGHYVLALKANRSKLFAEAQARFANARGVPRARQPSVICHDRRERRSAVVVPARDMAERFGFPAIKAIGRIVCWRRPGKAKATRIVRYFLMSRMLPPADLLKIVRGHWAIENNLHWVLDVVFAEDHNRSRCDNAPENLSVVRKLALSILNASSYNAPIRRKMLHAAWNNDYLLSLILHMR